MFQKKKRKGQSTVEYILVFAAVIAVIIIFTVSSNSPFRKVLNDTINSVVDEMPEFGTALGNHPKG